MKEPSKRRQRGRGGGGGGQEDIRNRVSHPEKVKGELYMEFGMTKDEEGPRLRAEDCSTIIRGHCGDAHTSHKEISGKESGVDFSAYQGALSKKGTRQDKNGRALS